MIHIVVYGCVKQQMEAQLRQTLKGLLETQRIGNIGSWEWDLKSNRVYCSKQLDLIFERDFSEFNPCAEQFIEFIHPEERESVALAVAASLNGNAQQLEHRIITPGGKVKWLEANIEVECDLQGNPVLMRGIAQDITRRKQAENQLRTSDLRLRCMADSMGDIVSQTDLQGKIQYISPSVKPILGYEPEDLLGELKFELVHPDDLEAVSKKFNQCIQSLKPGKVELRLRRRHGDYLWVEASGNFLYDEGKNPVGIVFVTRDITWRKKREEEMLRAARLEAAGILAGGIAHDFNNILTVFLSALHLARTNRDAPEKQEQFFGRMEAAINQARYLCNRLLTFSREEEPRKSTISVIELIQEAVSLVFCGSAAGYEIEIAGDLYCAELDKGQISQVLHNIMINALQAMSGSGVVKIKAENVSINTDDPPGSLPAGNYVSITVKDHGPGIPEEYLTRIFDPFFTTKPEGSGLGLAVSASIVHNHGGEICVDSRPGEGTSFKIILPAAVDMKPETFEENPEPNRSGGGWKVLLLDDNPSLVELVSELLGMIGYEVVGAATGEEAVCYYEQAINEGQPFDVVVADLTVAGGLGGKETLKRLLAIDPEVKAILSSGYIADPAMQQYRNYGFVGCMEKPYAIEDLDEEICRVIRENR